MLKWFNGKIACLYDKYIQKIILKGCNLLLLFLVNKIFHSPEKKLLYNQNLDYIPT